MKVAIIGSRTMTVSNLEIYLPQNTTEIVSGGARGIDSCAREYAQMNGIKLTEFLPEYEKYGRGAPIKRNRKIIDYADTVIAFWDGRSRGTGYVIDQCFRCRKNLTVYIEEEPGKWKLALGENEC